MPETAANFPDPEMPTITELGTERPKTDEEMTYLEKKNIDEAIHQKLRKKDVYESDMQKIYNLIVGQTKEQLQEKAASDATFQAVETDFQGRCTDLEGYTFDLGPSASDKLARTIKEL